VLELDDVRKHYPGPDGAAIRAVDGVSLTVERGELVALYGPSGSGKSTLLFLAAGIARPDDGAVRFDGRDLATHTRREATRYRRRELGFVFQTPMLAPGLQAIDNAALKLLASGMGRGDARRRAMPLLERLGLEGRARHAATQLSRGEQQRLALARALANEPRLLLADEPTGNLDTRRGGEVFALLAELCRERAVGVLLVTHDPSAAQHADRVLGLRDGRVSAGLPDSARAVSQEP
jgi:putative ABC transport system ATP-binding protein